MTKKNLIVTLANEKYLEQAKQLFSSIYWNSGWKGDYLLLAHETPDEKLTWFKEKGILIKHCKEINSERQNGKWPPVVLSKLYLFSPEFKKWKNIIFLDADIIVRAPLEDLTKIKKFGAIQGHKYFSGLILNRAHMFLEKIDTKPFYELKKKINFRTNSFNSGVLAFNTKIIKEDTFEKLKELTNKYFSISASGEELILNIYFYRQWQALSEIYNLYPDCVIPESGIKPKDLKAISLHFIINKPWNEKSPFYKEWKTNLENAEKINLNKKLKIKKWTDKEIKEYLEYLKQKRKNKTYIKWVNRSYNEIDRIIGLIGLTLKRYLPKLYYTLKNHSSK